MALKRKNADFAARLAGIDLAGNEGDGKAADFRERFMPFLQNCIHVTIHAGETELVESVWQAVYHLNAERAGHGLNLLENESLLRHFADRKEDAILQKLIARLEA